MEVECKEAVEDALATDAKTKKLPKRVRTKRKGYIRRLNHARLVAINREASSLKTKSDPMENMVFLIASIGDKFIGRKFQVMANGTVVVSYEPSKYADIVLKYDVGDAETCIPVRCHVRCTRSELFRSRSAYFEALLMQTANHPQNQAKTATTTTNTDRGAGSMCRSSQKGGESPIDVRKTPSPQKMIRSLDDDDHDEDATAGSSDGVLHASSLVRQTPSSSASTSSSLHVSSSAAAIATAASALPANAGILALSASEIDKSLPYASFPDPGTFKTVAHLIMFFDWILLDAAHPSLVMELRPSQVSSGNLATQSELYRLAGFFACAERAREDIVANAAHLLDILPPIERLEWGIHFGVPSFSQSGAMAILDANMSHTLTHEQLKTCLPFWQEHHMKHLVSVPNSNIVKKISSSRAAAAAAVAPAPVVVWNVDAFPEEDD